MKNTWKIEIFLFSNFVEISSREGIYIASQKSACWQPENDKTALPIDRPVDRLTVIFMTVVPPVDRPVDRDWIQRVTALGRSTRAIFRMQSSLAVDRPTSHYCRACLCTSVDRPVDRQKARSSILGFKNLVIYLQLNSIKSHKFHKNKFFYFLRNTNMCD